MLALLGAHHIFHVSGLRVNNYGRFQNLILLFKISMGTQKNFFKIYKQFGHVPLKRFASPALQVINCFRPKLFQQPLRAVDFSSFTDLLFTVQSNMLYDCQHSVTLMKVSLLASKILQKVPQV